MRAAMVVLLAACSPGTPLSGETAEAAKQYPDLFAIYTHDQGIYRGCGPTSGVCHNSNEFPNFDSLGSIVDTIGRDCNLKRQDSTTIHDLCERQGDRLVSGSASSEIAWIETIDLTARTWRVHLRDPMPLSGALEVERNDHTLYVFADYAATATRDAADDHAIVVKVPPPPVPTDPDDEAEPDFGLTVLARSGIAGDPEVIRVGDPNRNGTFGAELDGKIIRPGDPARSYLMSRLLDPTAGPLMPRANCCRWSKPAVRALYCWIEGLRDNGDNALAKIDYERCSTGPSVELLYPEPGPACEMQGLCPVEAASADDEPTFHNVYSRVLVPSCSGATCHGSGPVAGLDVTNEERAFATMMTKTKPGSPDTSIVYRRIEPTLCMAPDCVTMPLGRPPIPEPKRALVRAWIEIGAQR
jgi:hypothetical protein